MIKVNQNENETRKKKDSKEIERKKEKKNSNPTIRWKLHWWKKQKRKKRKITTKLGMQTLVERVRWRENCLPVQIQSVTILVS